MTNQFDEPFLETKKKCRVKQQLLKDPLFKIFKTNERISKVSEKMNSKLKEILHRCDVDRPILMRDKIDEIWEKENNDKIFD